MRLTWVRDEVFGSVSMLDPAGHAILEAKAGRPLCLGIIMRVQKRDSLGRQDEHVALGDSLASVLSPSSLDFDDCARLLVCRGSYGS